MSSRFYFGGSDDSGSDIDENGAALPFPKPLDRAAFLVPDFDAATFLSSLSNRFQTLEDLQSELRELSQSLNKELVDLVNENYQDFLSLGSTLAGGEERVEDIRVGLLAFQRDVKSIRDKIDQRRIEVADLLIEKRALKRDIRMGRSLLEVADRLEELEEKLGLKPRPVPTRRANDEHLKEEEKDDDEGAFTWKDDWDEEIINDSDDDYAGGESTGVPPRLKRRVEQLLMVKLMATRYAEHPFLLAEQPRLLKVHDTLMMDIEAAIKQEPDVKIKQQLLQLRMSLED